MTDGIESVTTAALGLALDAASLRQQVIAANIANANVAGYVPMTVTFEAQMEDARRDMAGRGVLDKASLAGIAPRIEPATDTGPMGLTPQVMLDVEVSRMAQNAVQYQALARGLSKHYAILSAAVNDGRK